jgi:hypothetical protein
MKKITTRRDSRPRWSPCWWVMPPEITRSSRMSYWGRMHRWGTSWSTCEGAWSKPRGFTSKRTLNMRRRYSRGNRKYRLSPRRTYSWLLRRGSLKPVSSSRQTPRRSWSLKRILPIELMRRPRSSKRNLILQSSTSMSVKKKLRRPQDARLNYFVSSRSLRLRLKHSSTISSSSNKELLCTSPLRMTPSTGSWLNILITTLREQSLK